MAHSINTSLPAARARRKAQDAHGDLATSVRRLSSGLRITGAKDDAAGLAIAERMDARLRGIHAAQRNVNDGISLAQVADGALGAISGNLQRIRELAVQAANSTNSNSDRAALQVEASQLLAEIDRVATQTSFNGSNLLDGSFAARSFQVGADVGQRVTMPAIADAHTSTLGTWAGFAYSGMNMAAPASPPEDIVFMVGSTTYTIEKVAPDTRSLVAAFNRGIVPGFSASFNSLVVAAGTSAANASVSGIATLTVNGVAISITGVAGAAGLAANRTAAVSAVNAKSAATGVMAVDTGTGVSLHTSDGRSIEAIYAPGTFTGSSKADFGLNASGGFNGPFSATVNVRYEAPLGVTGNVYFYQDSVWYSGGNVMAMGTPISRIDLASAAGAVAALESLDQAISSVGRSRASLGAVQNRFAAASQNLGAAGEHLTASQSRIRDADFALETASLTRAEILHEASTAMIAQASQIPREMVARLL